MNKLISCSLVAIIGLWIHPAMAYIDPGSGSAIMSAIIGIFVAGGMFVKTYWYKLKSIFSSTKKTESNNLESPEDQAKDPGT